MKLATDSSKQPTHEKGEPVDVNLGPWHVQHEFARGGMGVVYRAVHRHTGTPAAVKLMTWTRSSNPEYRKRFEDEVRSAARLSHPGIIDIYDYGDLSDWSVNSEKTGLPPSGPFVVMELARHGGLHQRNSQPHWPVCRGIIAGVLDSLAHAHARRVIHRDLKPANILFGRDTNQQLRVKLSDFGLAFVFESLPDSDQDNSLTGGTPTYMAPEQFRSNWREYGAWTDMYGLGCVAWELICGSPPFNGDSTLELAVQHTRDDLPEYDPQIDTPDGTEEWLRRMLAKEPADRFRYAADALRQLPAYGTHDEYIGIRLLDDPDLSEQSETDDEDNDEDDDSIATYPTLGSIANDPSGDIDFPEEFTPIVSFDRLSEDEKKVGETGAGVIPDPPQYEPPEDWRPPEVADELPPARRHEMSAVGLELAKLRDVPVVGRGHIRDEIWDVFLDTLATKDRHRVALTGPLGIGKSRIARWARERSQELGLAQGLSVSWPKNGRDSDSTGLSRMLRDVLNTDGASSEAASERIERWFERHPSADTGEGATIAPLIDDTPSTNRTKHTLTHVVAAVLNWLVVDPPIRYRRVRLRSVDQKAAVAARFIERMAARRPVVLQIDDPHTPEAHAFLRELRTIQQPVLGVVTADTSRYADDETLRERLDNVCNKRIEVGPLSEQKQKYLVSRILSVSPALTDEITRETDGNPRLAVDTVHGWASQKYLQPGAQGFELHDDANPEISDDVAQTVRNHIKPLVDDEPKSIIRATELGAAGGNHVDRRDWQDACKRANLPYPQGFIETLSREKVVKRETTEWQFTNTLARQFLLERAREGGRLADYHSVWADIIQRRDADPEHLAHHLVKANRHREALDPLVEAMNIAGWETNISTALRFLDHLGDIVESLDLPDDHPAKIEYHLGLVRKQFTATRGTDHGLEYAERALQGAERLGRDDLIGDALVQKARLIKNNPTEDEDPELLLRRALDLLDPERHPDRWTGAVTTLNSVLQYSKGNRKKAREVIEEALNRLDDVPPRQQITLRKFEARTHVHGENHPEAYRAVEQGIELAHEHNLMRHQLTFFNIAATLKFENGDLEEAEQLIKETLKLSRSEPSIEASVFELTLADILMARGSHREAFEHLTQLPTITEEQVCEAYPHVFYLQTATAACKLEFWEKAEPYLRYFLDDDVEFNALTREKRRLMKQLISALADHPDQSLREEVTQKLKSALEPDSDQ